MLCGANRVGRRPERFAPHNISRTPALLPRFEVCPFSGVLIRLDRVVSILSSFDFLTTDPRFSRLISSWLKRCPMLNDHSRCFAWFWRTVSACRAWSILLHGFPFVWAHGGQFGTAATGFSLPPL